MSELVVVELRLGGTALFADAGTRLFRITKGQPGSPPVVRGSDVRIPHLAGAIARSRLGDHLDIELEGWQTAPENEALDDARSDHRQGVRALLALFRSASITVTELEALLEDGSTATIDVRVVPPVLTDETVPGLATDFSVALVSVDPEWVIEDGS